jgi:Tol biopolymer transport system component
VPTDIPPTDLPTFTPEPLPTLTPIPVSSSYDLAFVSDRDAPSGNLIPYIVNSNNLAEYRQYGNPSGYERTQWPTFCGNRLAVEALDLQNNQKQWIYLYDESGQPYQLDHTQNADYLGIPRCSPNGKYLAYTARSGEYADIYITDVESGQFLHQPNARSYGKLAVYTSWLGDSSSFVFEVVIKNKETYLYVDGFPAGPSSPSQISLGDNGVLARFSPDGSQAAFSCNDGQLCVSNNGGNARSIFTTDWSVKVTDWTVKVSPVWSADGQWIYFASVDGGDWDIFRIRPDGTGLKNVTEAWTSNEITPATR